MKTLARKPAGDAADLSAACWAIDRSMFEVMRTDASLQAVLSVLCRSVEQQATGLICSILLVDESGTRLLHGAAPSLPDSYNKTVHSFAIGPGARSCGAAAYHREPVIVSDISRDARWEEYRDVAIQHGLHACWSSPIISRESKLLGTFAIYYREPRLPTTRERHLVEWATQIAGIAIERSEADQALRKQREELETILDSAPAMIWFKDRENRIVRANRSAAEVMGVEKRQLEGRSTAEFFPDDADRFYQDDLEAIRSGSPKLNIQGFLRTSKGEQRRIVTDKLPVHGSDGSVVGVVIMAQDVTEQMRAQTALHLSEMSYRSMVERAPYGIYRSDPRGRLLSVNPAMVQMLGYDTAEQLMEVNLGSDIYQAAGEHEALIRQNLDQLDYSETSWRKKDGTLITVSLRGRAVRDSGGDILYFDCIVEEVTERRKLEAQLRQAQKMEAVGRLVGGIAHDFNNLLLVIRGQLELLSEHIEDDHPGKAGVRKARQAADRASSLTRQLLAFGRMQVLQPRVINLNAIVREMSKLLLPLLGRNIDLTLKLHSELAAVKADPGQMEQVILNLAVNARDAMPGGGSLTIETANVTLDEAYARAHTPLTAGQYVMLAVYDIGMGMDKETQARIFEPFFTTKEQGKGTGLGLATVYGIVKQSRGFIWVTSEPDQGAAFQIYLPRVDEAVEEIKRPGQEPAPTGRETVLVAEDDDGVRDVACQFLRKCGYRVLEARNGIEAVAIAGSYPERIDVLVTDMVMPGLNGQEAAARIAGLRSGIKVICMSGYSEHSEIPLVEGLSVMRLQKPFTREAMAQAVRDAIDASTRPGRQEE